MRSLLVASLAAAALAAPAALAQSSEITTFRTPSGNILCAYLHFQGAPKSLRCDILSGLKPRPAKPKGCEFDWGASVGLGATGRTKVLCVSDAVSGPDAKPLAYGKTFRGGPFTCLSQTTGLRCSNTAGHGFFLSRERWYRF